MAKRNQQISVGGKNTGQTTQVEAVNMSGALDPQKHADLVAEAAREHYEGKEELRQLYGENLENLPESEGVVLSTEGPQVAPYVTSKSIMEKPKASLPLAERFKHLSEAELQLVAQANSWDKEFTLTVLENRRRETSEVDHAPYCPSEVEIVVDEGHTI